MDMWKAFRKSTLKNALDALIVYDKFHVIGHLSKALDQVRREEHKRLSGKYRSYIKDQRYTLLPNTEELYLDGRKALKKLLAAENWLNTAYLLQEMFGQLWDYMTARGARAFFGRWKDSLKCKRQKPYAKFAAMVERHWDGMASYCHPDNKVSLGLVEGVNNKIRVIQRKSYGYLDEAYLKLNIIVSFEYRNTHRMAQSPWQLRQPRSQLFESGFDCLLNTESFRLWCVPFTNCIQGSRDYYVTMPSEVTIEALIPIVYRHHENAGYLYSPTSVERCDIKFYALDVPAAGLHVEPVVHDVTEAFMSTTLNCPVDIAFTKSPGEPFVLHGDAFFSVIVDHHDGIVPRLSSGSRRRT